MVRKMSNNQKLIKHVQAYLILAGHDVHDTLIADGDWDDVSVEAMMDFQMVYELEPTGMIDVQTVCVMCENNVNLSDGGGAYVERYK